MVIVSLTSIPPRFSHLPEILTYLRNQTVPVTIILNIPYTYSRFPEPFECPSFDGVIVNRCRDFGPGTKILATLELLRESPNDQIVVVDDDHMYDPRTVETLLAEAEKHPHSAITIKSYPMTQTRGIQPRGNVHYIAGSHGFLIQPKFFSDPRIFDLHPRTPQFYVDDIWISGFLELSKIPIYQTSVKLSTCLIEEIDIKFPLYEEDRVFRNKQTIRYFQSKFQIWVEPTRWALRLRH